jgi:hypothetical protein
MTTAEDLPLRVGFDELGIRRLKAKLGAIRRVC